MTVTKQTIRSLLVLSFAVAANAGRIERSGDSTSGSASTIANALRGFSADSCQEVRGSVASTARKASNSASALKDGALYIFDASYGVSKDAARSTSNNVKAATSWVLTTSGNLLRMTRDASVATLHASEAVLMDPVGMSSNALDYSGQKISIVVDASGRVFVASGEVLRDSAGAAYDLVKAPSGAIYELSAGSVVASRNGARALLTFVGNSATGSLEHADISSQDLQAVMSASANSSKSAFSSSSPAPEKGEMYK